MSVTFGFYNSLNGDRKYNALQMSSIFDGIIRDGVFASIGTAFAPQASGGLTVDIGIGKAWFNHTWTLNDAVLPLTFEDAEVLLDRIDAVVVEVNTTEEVRANSIKIVKGVPSSSAKRPDLRKSNGVFQYAICYIFRKAGSSEIAQANITPVVGSEETPFVTGILETVSLETLLGKWQDNLDTFIKNKTSEFQNWFDGTKDILSDDVAGNLTNKISAIENTFERYATKEYVDNATPVLPVQMRYVNQNGVVSETASENTFLQVFHPVDEIWEWADIPEIFNIEYRTRERFDNKIVYSKFVAFGKLPNNTVKAVAYMAGGVVDYPVRVSAWIARHVIWMRPLPLFTLGNDNMQADMDRTNVRIRTFADWSNYSVNVRVWYTKVK